MDTNKFIQLSKIQASVDYTNATSVKDGNIAAAAMIAIASQCNKTNDIDEFLDLLDHDTAGTVAAYTVVDLIGIDKNQKKMCINKIKTVANSESIESTGAKYWLQDRGYSII